MNSLRVIKLVLATSRNFTTISSVPRHIEFPEVVSTGIFINNEWHKSDSRATFPTFNPANEKLVAEIQHGGKADIDKAVQAANEAFRFGSPWRILDASERGKLLFRLAELVDRDAQYLASLETVDTGKPYHDCLNGDVLWAAKLLRYMAGWADKNHGKTIQVDGPYLAYTRHEPVGVCAGITPFNVPFYMATAKIGPVVATGCTLILKPPQQSPLSTLHLGELVKEAGIPPGVINIVPGFQDAGEALTSHPNVDKISFTGSCETGKLVQQQAGLNNLKRVTLELGGKSPVIVLPDADIAKAVEMAHFASFFHQGQTCGNGSRTFIHESIYDEFVERSIELAKKRKLGNPFHPDTQQGPQIDQTQLSKILGLVKEGVFQGAKLVYGGNRHGDLGYYVQPTVLADVEDHHVVASKEIFGPVQQLMKFKSFDELIERANKTEYGIAAAIFSKDIDKVNYIMQGLRVGTVWINTYFALSPQAPFGGYKCSGISREYGEDGIKPYTEIKTVITSVPQKNS